MHPARSVSRFFGLLALVLVLHGNVSAVRAEGLQKAISESKQTGKPVLVLGLSPTCPHCEQLKKRMVEEPKLKALVAQYVVTKTQSLEDPDALVLLKTYPPKVAGTPILIGIAPNGVELFNQAGAPEGEALLKTLQEGLAKSAQLVPPRPAAADRDPRAQAPRSKLSKKAEEPEEASAAEEPAKSKGKAKEATKAKKPALSPTEQAAGFLRMARKLTDPEKVRKYAQKAIDIAPDSQHAAAARELIESLK